MYLNQLPLMDIEIKMIMVNLQKQVNNKKIDTMLLYLH